MWKSRAGTVSLSLILLLAPMFAFHAALIDAARAKMGERQTEAAAKAALRSVLSAYDPSLRNYGLFAIGQSPEESRELFGQVFKDNLDAGGADGAYRLIVPAASSTTLQPLYTLGNKAVFQRQVLEEMKYRAPIEFALSVTDKLKNKSGATSMLSGVSSFTKQAQAIEQLLEQRDDELDEAWTSSQRLVEKAGLFRAYYARKLERLDELCRLIGLRDAEEVTRSIQSLKAQAEAVRRSIAERQAGLAGMLQAGVQAAEAIAAIQQSINELERSLGEMNRQIGDLETILRYIAEYTLLLQTTKLEAKRDQQTVSALTADIFQRLDRAKALDERIREQAGASASSTAELSPEVWAVASKPDSYYMQYKTGVGGIGALFNGFEAALDATTLFVGAAKFDSVRMQVLSDSNNAYGAKAEQFAAAQGAEEERGNASRSEIAKRKKEQKTKFAGVWDEARKLWAACGNGDSDAYARLETGNPASGEAALYRKYAEYNRTEPVVAAGVDEMGDADKAMKQTTGMIDKLLEGISNAAGAFRDELYINEYALTTFNYRTYGKEKEPDGQPKKEYGASQRDSHQLQGQEAEYLLYGLGSCLKNQSAAYTEMFAIRLAIRTAEALMAPESKIVTFGNPLLTLLWALAEGAGKAFIDMTKLVNGEEVVVSSKAPPMLTMGYKDYLRLFMLIQTKRDPMTARMQSLIDLNTGCDLRQAVSQMQARTETKLGLWFMPYTMTAFGYPTEGNKAVIAKSVVLSY
ncbi:hypothetical protein ACFFNY_27120 [Paenibacillus hodogayensis]|uniref:Uncharacterized protein n=1 Tax=Paenibacillus hodogayensis TaxID=279208 RepID=A0ABV5W3W7_9BACL